MPADDMHFSAEEWRRYTRHIQLPQFGSTGQLKLKQSHVLIVGCGGLGSPVGLYLAAAGIGELTLVDHDSVDLTNLQRQILFTTEDAGSSKAESASNRLGSLNPGIQINAVKAPFNIDIADELISAADLVIDCTDNFNTRYLINDACVKHGKPWVFASIHQFDGQCSLFTPDTGCFRCLFPDLPTQRGDCNTAGVLGVLPGLLGTIQASEAIKYLSGLETPLAGKIMLVDAIALDFRQIKLNKSPDCIVCGDGEGDLFPFYDPECTTSDTGAPACKSCDGNSFDQYTDSQNYQILDVRSQSEHSGFNLGGDLISLDNLEANLNTLPKDKTILCYCQSGKRGERAVALLEQHGFKAINLQGGISQYLAEKGL